MSTDLKIIPRGSIKAHTPKCMQRKGYSCGAAVFRILCKYFKVGPKTEKDCMKLLKTNCKRGTEYIEIVRNAVELGLHVKVKMDMDLSELKQYLDEKIPIICSIQAWGNPANYDRAIHGHYVIAIGYDQENIYFEDPSIFTPSRGYLGKKEFLERWHDIDGESDKDCNGLGIAIWKDSYKPTQRRIKQAVQIE